MFPKFLLSSARNHGRQSVNKDTEITLLQDGMTVRLVTISVKSSPALILHEPVLMGESFYSLLPYLCSGYPRLASQELAFYHAYSGGWRNRCGIPWPLPACHAIYLLAEFYSVYIAQHWGIINVLLLCHGHEQKKKQQKSGPNTAFVKALQMKLLLMHGDGALKTALHH